MPTTTTRRRRARKVRPLVLYHRTTVKNANRILAHGFKDATGTYLTEQEWSGVPPQKFTGVWLSDQLLDINEGVPGDVVFVVTLDLSEAELDQYEWVEEGKPYREWLVPAELVNQHWVRCRLQFDSLDLPSSEFHIEITFKPTTRVRILPPSRRAAGDGPRRSLAPRSRR